MSEAIPSIRENGEQIEGFTMIKTRRSGPRRQWEDDEHKSLISMRAEGKTYTQIATILARPLSSIMGRLGKTDEFGVYQSIPKTFEKRKPEDVEMVMDLHEAGASHDEMAKAIGRSKWVIANILKQQSAIRRGTALPPPAYSGPMAPAMRACLGPICEGKKKFLSPNAGVRICPRCRESAANISPIAA